jgi:hypothetical protein
MCLPLNARLRAKKGGTMKTISMMASDRAFKAISALSCGGLALSFCLMAFGMDLSVVAI